MVKLVRLALKELRSQFKIQTFLVLNLALGIFGFFILQIFQQNLSLQTETKAQEILGGDFSISARRLMTEDSVSALESKFQFKQKTELFSFFAMAQSKSRARLVQVRAFKPGFPLYGRISLTDKTLIPVEENINTEPIIWVDPEIQAQLDLTLNEASPTKIKLGQTDFTVKGLIFKDPTRTFRAGAFAPTAYIEEKFLKQTGLIQPGSTLNHIFLYRLENIALGSAIEKNLSLQVKDNTLRFETAVQDADSDNRVLKYFSDYLGLVSLVALGLCFLSGGYLLRWIFLEQKKNIAIYKTLGLQESEIIAVQVLKNTTLSFISFLISLMAVLIALPFLQNLIYEFNLPLDLKIDFKSSFIICLLSLVIPQIMSFPLNFEILQLRPKDLFQSQISVVRKTWLFWAWLVVSILLFWTLTLWQSQSFKTGTLFTVGLALLYVLFKAILFVVVFIVEKLIKHFSWMNRYALLGLIRRSSSTDLVFITMSLSLLILSLLPHLKTSIIEEIRPSKTSQIPAIFMFDIQPEQVEPLKKITKAELNKDLSLTPLVRSRILKLNDADYERAALSEGFTTREQEEDARFRNRGVNLTYKSQLQESEKVIKGRWNGETHSDSTKVPEISLEERYAGRIGAKLGDTLTFDVQGVPLQGQVTSIRQVRWTSFQPNFFIVFPPGVLEDSPQNFLTSVTDLSGEQINQFQLAVVDQLPNVSIINVKETVKSSLVFIDQMSFALEAMAYLSMLVGLFVFVILLNTQIKERLTEMNLLQILGLSNQKVKQIILRQFVFLISLSLISGLGLSLISAYVVVSYLFNIGTTFDMTALIRLCLIVIPTSAVGLWYGLRPLQKLSPNDLIRTG